MEKKQKGIGAVVFALCLLVLLAVPASAASSDDYGLAIAAAWDSNDNIIAAEYAIVANYSNGTYVDTPASLVSPQAASYGVLIGGSIYDMDYLETFNDLEMAEFKVTGSSSSSMVTAAPDAEYVSKDEAVYVVYFYNDGDSVGTVEIQFNGNYVDMDDFVVLGFDILGSVDSSIEFPAAVIDSYGYLVGYVSLTGGTNYIYTYLFDETYFSGSSTPAPNTPAPNTPAPNTPAPNTPAPNTPEPNTPAPNTPAPNTPVPSTSGGSSNPGGPGRNPYEESSPPTPSDSSDSSKSNLPLYIGIGAIAAAVVVAVVVFVMKKGGNKGNTAAPVNMPYQQPLTPSSGMLGTPPADIPPTTPHYYQQPAAPVQPAAPQRITPVVYGMSGEMAGRRYVITSPSTAFGRQQTCQICFSVNTPGISHEHCVLLLNNGAVMLMDNGSTYGTYLQGQGRLPAKQPVPLKNGDVFYLGEQTNSFRLAFE